MFAVLNLRVSQDLKYDQIQVVPNINQVESGAGMCLP